MKRIPINSELIYPGGIRLSNHGSRHNIGEADEIPDLASHGGRHGYGQADAIPSEALRFSQIDKVFGSEQSVTVTAGGTSTIPKGIYLVSLAADVSVEYTPDGGSTWRTVLPAGTGGVIISDGSSVRFNNSGASDETCYLLPVQ